MSGGTYIGTGFGLNPQADIETLAEKAMTKPREFMYWGDKTVDSGWGWTGLAACRNEDDAINRSNLRVIHEDLAERFPDDVAIETSSHWAVGSMDELRVRVKRDGQITDAFRAVVVWAERLSNYPVASDEDYSDLEHEEAMSAGMIYCEDRQEYAFPSDCARDKHEHEGVPQEDD